MKYIKLFNTDSDRVSYEDSENYLEPYVSYVEGDNSVHYNKPKFFCKLTLNDDSVVELEGSGELTQSMINSYKSQGIKEAEIGKLCTAIGEAAFQSAAPLSSVTIADSVRSIGKYAFQSVSGPAMSITIPNSVTSIGERAFNGWRTLSGITLPNTLTKIENEVFDECQNLTSVTIPNSVISIGERAFNGCNSLLNVTIPNSVTNIDNQAFQYCNSLTNVEIPNSITSIEDYVFAGCSGLTNVTIPNSVTNIGYGAFQNCSGLSSITIPDSVTSIGNSAFFNCPLLTSITSLATTAPTITNYTFDACGKNGTLYVPIGSTGYDVWMGTGYAYLGFYNWTKVEQ